MQRKVTDVLNIILEQFKQPDALPKAVALAAFPPMDIPSSKWSLMNRVLMFYSGTNDARGIRQWNMVKRNVKAGSKAMYILGPVIKKIIDTDFHESEVKVLSGFRLIPVFKVEDTTGEPLAYENIELPELPLLEKANELGVTVRTAYFNNRFLGAYHLKSKQIALASPEESVFFHELSHAAHEKVCGKLKGGQQWRQEIVAELSAQALCYLVGKEPERTMGNSYRYIERYAKENHLSAVNACMKVLGDAEKVLNLLAHNNIPGGCR